MLYKSKMESLLIEKYAWVDQGLEELYYRYALTAENCDEYQDAGLLHLFSFHKFLASL